MPSYQVAGRGKETGRSRTGTYQAYDEAEAIAKAESEGTVVDKISLLPEPSPTEAQIAYATDLGIKIPPNATKWEVRDLISCRVDGDKPSTERHRSFAKLYRIECTQYMGKGELFDWIQNKLREPGHEQEMAEWFAYRVYRELVEGADNAPIEGPKDPIIQEIAAELVKDPSVVTSIRRYEGRNLIWFGQWTSPDGYQHEGGSNRTMAYKQANALLREKLGITRERKAGKQDIAGRQGCVVSAMLTIIVLLTVVALLLVR
jgi:hypothetical protein